MTTVLCSAAAIVLLPEFAHATELGSATLSLAWGLPFAGILLSVALFPILALDFWHHHFGKITALWTMLFVSTFTVAYGLDNSIALTLHALLAEYIPFIVLLFSLYTVSGGILICGSPQQQGSPALNTTILATGTVLASIMGTTGAAMLLIRPLLRANERRKNKVHLVVFFIFLVANIGGGLTSLGDPPLFLGFLMGVSFGWTIQHMALPVLTLAAALLFIFYALDNYLLKQERQAEQLPETYHSRNKQFKVHGKRNLCLLTGIVCTVLMSGIWKPDVRLNVMGTHLQLQDIIRDLTLVGLALTSLWITPKQVRTGNEFSWAPILEVAKLFAGIFITIAPVITMLRAGTTGPLASLVHMVSNVDGQPNNAMYFWMTGILSSFLDNAPTYLVFFNLAHGDPQVLMGPMADTLLAISMGAVFMGANTYIGNAPNFMVKSIAEHHHVKMPNFFGYLGWSSVILLPLFVLMTLMFF